MTGNVLKNLLDIRKLTQSDLARDLGVSRQSVGRWVSGRPIDDKNLKKLANYFGVTEAEIRYGISQPVSVYDEGDEPPDDVVIIKEYKLTFGAHASGMEAEPEWVIDEEGEDYWYRRSFFQHRHLNPDRCKRAKVTGDSMEPTICSGDKILFYEELDSRPGCVIIQDGRVYTMSVDGQLKVKRLSKTKEGIVVRSDNPTYEPEIYTGHDVERLRIYGRVIEINRTI